MARSPAQCRPGGASAQPPASSGGVTASVILQPCLSEMLRSCWWSALRLLRWDRLRFIQTNASSPPGKSSGHAGKAKQGDVNKTWNCFEDLNSCDANSLFLLNTSQDFTNNIDDHQMIVLVWIHLKFPFAFGVKHFLVPAPGCLLTCLIFCVFRVLLLSVRFLYSALIISLRSLPLLLQPIRASSCVGCVLCSE